MNRLAILVLSAALLVAGSGAAVLGVGISSVGNKKSTCVLIDSDSDLTGTNDFTLVSVSPHEKRLTCKADHVSNTSGKTLRYDANHNPYSGLGKIIPCFDGSGGITKSWRESIRPSGAALLQCYFKT